MNKKKLIKTGEQLKIANDFEPMQEHELLFIDEEVSDNVWQQELEEVETLNTLTHVTISGHSHPDSH